MKWSIQQLEKNLSFPYCFECEIDFTNQIIGNENIISIDKVKVEGNITKIKSEKYLFTYHIFSKLILPCSLTLEPVDYIVDLTIEEVLTSDINELDDDSFLIEKNTIDLDQMVWSNIISSIPIRVVRDDAYEILAKRNIKLNDIPDEIN